MGKNKTKHQFFLILIIIFSSLLVSSASADIGTSSGQAIGFFAVVPILFAVTLIGVMAAMAINGSISPQFLVSGIIAVSILTVSVIMVASTSANFVVQSLATNTNLDQFGIEMLNPTISGGRTWFSNWNTPPHQILSGAYDPYDSQFQARGNGYTNITGSGQALMSGSAARMYVKDPTLVKLWNNVEVTIYGKRVSDTPSSAQGLTIGARSGSHDDVTYPDVCTDSIGYPNTAYNGRLTYDGRADYVKEVLYHRGDATGYGNGTYPHQKPAFPDLSTPIDGATGYHTFPNATWVGEKFVVRDNGTGVTIQTWRDMTDGKNGGNWTMMSSFTDKGNWSVFSWYSGWNAQNWPCPTVPLDYVIKHPMPYIFVRADNMNEIDYKKFSIREINPIS